MYQSCELGERGGGSGSLSPIVPTVSEDLRQFVSITSYVSMRLRTLNPKKKKKKKEEEEKSK